MVSPATRAAAAVRSAVPLVGAAQPSNEARIGLKPVAADRRRNLGSLPFPIFGAREKGERFGTARWIAAVTAELGPDEKGRFERLILRGEDTFETRHDTFGPCFLRRPACLAKDGKDIAGSQRERAPDVSDSTRRKR